MIFKLASSIAFSNNHEEFKMRKLYEYTVACESIRTLVDVFCEYTVCVVSNILKFYRLCNDTRLVLCLCC